MKKNNMSNLSSASPGSGNNSNTDTTAVTGGSGFFSQQILQSFASPDEHQPTPAPSPSPSPAPPSKKRSLPGNPDPDAEVIALSPKSLLATNRFLCEICNKGFQRDQNLQLHRRGHNLPWKLKQRSSKDVVRKKVYVCPEPTCVHHDPSRALGDLTGVKKHFCRKHGEKKWKCDKCSKRYAVQSDWKAHSKICGTREYKCDCGTIFSRRDSFITHRAFCDALAQETSRPINSFSQTNQLFMNSNISNLQHQLTSHGNLQPQEGQFPSAASLSIKRELQDHHQQQQHQLHLFNPASQLELLFSGGLDSSMLIQQTRLEPEPLASPHLVMPEQQHQSNNNHHHLLHMPATTKTDGSSGSVFPSSEEEMMTGGNNGGGSFTCMEGNRMVPVSHQQHHHHLLRDQMMTAAMTMMNSNLYSSSGAGLLEGLSYLNESPFDQETLLSGMLNNPMKPGATNNYGEQKATSAATTPRESHEQQLLKRTREGMTRDFLGLRAVSSSNGFDILRNSSSSSSTPSTVTNNGQQIKDNKDQNQILWPG